MYDAASSYKDWIRQPHAATGIAAERRELLDAILEPFIETLRQYDEKRQEIEQKGGKVSDLQKITNLLNQEQRLCLNGNLLDKWLQLSKPEEMRQTLRWLHSQLYLDVRQRQSRMPVYYLCRIHRDFWAEHSLIVEDVYMSPGFPVSDERFIQLMDQGHEVFFLRMAQFREKILSHDSMMIRGADALDSLLYDLGRYVFQASWHEDQRLAFAVAECFNLPLFQEAIMLLYLILGGELCALRSGVTPAMMEFFNSIYRNRALYGLLTILPDMEGKQMNDLPKQAIEKYKQLTKAFHQFLAKEIEWGQKRLKLPLWKIIYSNYSRLKFVQNELKNNPQLDKIKCELEITANSIILSVLVK